MSLPSALQHSTVWPGVPIDALDEGVRARGSEAGDLADPAQHALDRVGFRRPLDVPRRSGVEHDDVAVAGGGADVREPVDHDAVAGLEGGLHRSRRHPVRLRDEAQDQPGHDERGRDVEPRAPEDAPPPGSGCGLRTGAGWSSRSHVHGTCSRCASTDGCRWSGGEVVAGAAAEARSASRIESASLRGSPAIPERHPRETWRF